MRSIRPVGIARIVKDGALLGIAGGTAEIIWIAFYGSLAGSDAGEVARAITNIGGRLLPSFSLASAPIIYGIVIHMLAALGLGIALVLVWQALTGRGQARLNVYTFMLGALAIVWTLNFFVILPLIGPAFVELVPYPVSLMSKLLFGLAGAIALRSGAGGQSASIPVRASVRRPRKEG